MEVLNKLRQRNQDNVRRSVYADEETTLKRVLLSSVWTFHITLVYQIEIEASNTDIFLLYASMCYNILKNLILILSGQENLYLNDKLTHNLNENLCCNKRYPVCHNILCRLCIFNTQDMLIIRCLDYYKIISDKMSTPYYNMQIYTAHLHNMFSRRM